MAFDLQGHRGARGLAPENTLAGFARALEIGVTTLETDLAVTKDGVLVLSHDPVLNPDIVRGPDGQWLAAPGPAINSLTLAELKRYDIGRIKPGTKYAQQFPSSRPVDGQRIPTLAELFAPRRGFGQGAAVQHRDQAVARQARRGAGPRNLRAPGRGGRARSRARAAHHHPVLRLAHADGGKATGAGDRDRLPHLREDPAGQGRRRRAPALALAGRPRSGGLRRLGAAAGGGGGLRDVVALLPRAERRPRWRRRTRWASRWCRGPINARDDLARIIDMKVDGLITDYPDRAREVMAAKGIPLP